MPELSTWKTATVLAEAVDVELDSPQLQEVHRVLDHGQGLQPEEVELHQARGFDPFHVELRGGHV
jgi:hypothetical protein